MLRVGEERLGPLLLNDLAGSHDGYAVSEVPGNAEVSAPTSIKISPGVTGSSAISPMEASRMCSSPLTSDSMSWSP